MLIVGMAVNSLAAAQPVLHFKTREIRSTRTDAVSELNSPVRNGRGHLVLQFEHAPDAAVLAALASRGITVLGDVPVNGVLVSLEGRADVVGLGIIYADRFDPADKISPLIAGAGAASGPAGYYLVEFYSDVNLSDARALALNSGLLLQENPDLNPQQLLVYTPAVPALTVLQKLAANDAVAYIFPASSNLVNGVPAAPYAGALTTNGSVGQSIPTYGPGWGGSTTAAVTLNYVFSQMTEKLPTATTQAAIERAMTEWAKVIDITWQNSTSATANRTVNIMFATGAHGDGFPFNGPGGILAHTFYPAPPNPEPLAGDMHFDDSQSWQSGTDVDVYSVALHELGHSLGLGHSDDPTDVMYPYYKMVSTLSAGDVAAILTLYAPQTGTPKPVGLTPAPASTPVAVPAAAPVPTPTPSPVPAPTPTPTSPSTGTTSATQPTAKPTVTPTPTTPTATVPISTTPTATLPTATTPTKSGSGASGPAKNTTPPTLTITSPSQTSVSSLQASMTFTGTASDSTGVAGVSWSTNMGYSGTATGTTQWSASVPLIVGSNTVTITATDTAGNSSWRSVVVSYQ